uniref:Putative complexin-1 n=1 Tax=Meloidogyne javanica TaxID=6303 RepID=A0A915MEC5_MELJA
MAGFLMKQMVGNKLDEVTGGLNRLGGDDENKTLEGDDPEVIAARQEMEERRKEKHRKMELEREKMRDQIRNKYSLNKKDDAFGGGSSLGIDGRVGPAHKTPDQLAAEMAAEEDSIIGQLGLTEHVEKAKTAVNTAFDTFKGFFGK